MVFERLLRSSHIDHLTFRRIVMTLHMCEPKKFVAVEGADHNDILAVFGLGEYRKLLMSRQFPEILA